MQKLWWFIKNGIAYYSSIKKITVVLCLFTVNILYPQQSPPGISFPPGYTSGSVTDVSGDGSVLVGSILPDGSSDTKPFRFISNNFEILPQLGTDYSSAVAIARDTMMIAGYSIVATHPQAWRVDPESQIVALGHLANDNSSTPYDISGDGNIIVGWSYGRGGSDGEAFLWEEGEGMTGLGTLSQTNQGSAAHGVSADGSVVVGLSHIDTGEWRAFRWTQGTGIQNLGILPGYDQSQADYVSDDGQVIVGFSSKNGTADNQIFRWVSGTMTGLGNYGGGSWSVIQYVSPTGSIIVATSSEFTTVVWDEQNGWRSLEDVWESNFGVQIQGWDNQLMVGGISVNDSIWAGNGWSQANGNQLWIVGSNNSSVAWSNGNGGSFNEGSNWIGGLVPDDSQTALFDVSNYTTFNDAMQPITVTFDDIAATSGLTVLESQVTFDLQAHSYGIENLIFDGPGGLPDESQLEIINGALGVTESVDIGVNGAVGQLIVGSGGTLEVSSTGPDPLLRIGDGNCGGGDCARLLIQDGGIVYSNGVEAGRNNSHASILLDGLGSQWNDALYTVIGDSGTGSFTISGGGLYSGKELFAGKGNNSQGTITLSGEDSKILLDEILYVGFYGNGTLNVTNSSEVDIIGETILGAESGSNGELVVNGSQSQFTTDDLTVGDVGSGGLTVSNTATALVNHDILVPGSNNGIGSVLVDGDGTDLNIAGDLRIGFPGVGFVRLTDLGTLTVNAIHLGPLGSIDITGGIVFVGGNSPMAGNNIAGNDNPLLTGGSVYVDTLLISENAELLASTVEFGEGGYLGGEGSFSFDVINSGGLNPGDSINTPGLFTIDANFTQQGNGTLFIELEGNTPGTGFDQLTVNSDAQISGTLDVSALNLFEPFVGQTFEILTANNVTGNFDNVIGHRGLDVDVTYNATSITITVTSPVSVDDNNENKIPTEFSLEQNYPNPFNPTTRIKYQIPQANSLLLGGARGGFVTLKVYDILGNEVATLVNEEKPAGNYEVVFNAENLPSGVYFYQIQAGNPSTGSGQSFVETKKLLLLK